MKATTQPNKSTAIPTTATLWAHSLVNPFFKEELTECCASLSTMLTFERKGHPYLEFDNKTIDKTVVYRYVEDKWYEVKRWQFVNNEWQSVEPIKPDGKRYVEFAHKLTPLKQNEHPKDAKRLNTIHGMGTLIGIEKVTNRRIMELDNNPFSYTPVYLFQKEVLKPAA